LKNVDFEFDAKNVVTKFYNINDGPNLATCSLKTQANKIGHALAG
jgi:hypothetical protein